jgi:hypothetical protein
MGLPLPKSCASLDAVVSAAVRDAVESGYAACRRHLISAVLHAPDINKYLPGVGEFRIAELRLCAALATNMTRGPRRPNHDLGRSAGFDAALRDAAKLTADIGAACVCPSHLLAALMENPTTDEDGIDPSFWDWGGVTVEHPADCG